MTKIRATRVLLYTGNCPGRMDLTAREGHYFDGDNFQAAVVKACHKFPGEPLDVENDGQYEGRYMLRHPDQPEEHLVRLPDAPAKIER